MENARKAVERIFRNNGLGSYLLASLRLSYILILAITIFIPLFYAFHISFRDPGNVFDPFVIIPAFRFANWFEAWSDLLPLLQNSYIRAVGSTILVLMVNVPAAYAFARKDFKYKSGLFLFTVGVMLFPVIILVVPYTVAFHRIGLFDTIVGLMIVDVMLITPMAVWLLRDYFSALPADLEEAAQVYGCTAFQSFYRTILPLAVPGILAVAFFAFVISWNEFLFAMLLTTQDTRPAIVQLNNIMTASQNRSTARIMAKALIISIPPAIMYLIARRSLRETVQ